MSLGSTLRRILDDQRVRFLIVGGFNTAFGFLAFVLVQLTLGRWLSAEVSPVISSVVTLIVSHLMAAVVAFFLYRRFVFRVSGNLGIDFLRFESVYLVPLGVNLIVLPAVVAAGVSAILAQGVILAVMTVVSYVGHRYFSFRRKDGRISDESPVEDRTLLVDPESSAGGGRPAGNVSGH